VFHCRVDSKKVGHGGLAGGGRDRLARPGLGGSAAQQLAEHRAGVPAVPVRRVDRVGDLDHSGLVGWPVKSGVPDQDAFRFGDHRPGDSVGAAGISGYLADVPPP
jgi:hypothetical protein